MPQCIRVDFGESTTARNAIGLVCQNARVSRPNIAQKLSADARPAGRALHAGESGCIALRLGGDFRCLRDALGAETCVARCLWEAVALMTQNFHRYEP